MSDLHRLSGVYPLKNDCKHALRILWTGINALNSNTCFSKQMLDVCRAGGNGTTGTAMAVPVFEEEKWRCLDFNLHVHYRMASPSGSL